MRSFFNHPRLSLIGTNNDSLSGPNKHTRRNKHHIGAVVGAGVGHRNALENKTNYTNAESNCVKCSQVIRDSRSTYLVTCFISSFFYSCQLHVCYMYFKAGPSGTNSFKCNDRKKKTIMKATKVLV